jgi:DNA-binding NarL/FixJ family response regulator
MVAAAMIRVLLAEDHPVVRTGLEELLGSEEGIEVVGSFGDGAQAVESIATLDPDVILLDISMPVMTGIEATRRILELRPDARIVILTASAERDRIVEAVDAGALGYLLKDAAPADLIEGIRTAARGEAPLDPKVARELLLDRRATSAPELTAREREVLALVGEGLANKVIAQRLEISEKTVKAHLTRVYERIGVSDRTQAALWAGRHGYTAKDRG